MLKVVSAAAVAVSVSNACDIMKLAMDCSTEASAEANCDTYTKQMSCMANVPGCVDYCKTVIDSLKSVVPADCTLSCDPSSCFPGLATVELSSGKMIQMDQLKIGDKVRVSATEFSEVYYFSTSMSSADTTSKFIKVVAGNTTLQLTPGHYLYVNGELTLSEKVQAGDVVVLASGEKASVTEVGSSWAGGLYNPHTLHGDIVVNGVLTSTYTEAVHPTLAHALLSPLRAMYAAGAPFGSTFSALTKGLPKWVLNAIKA